MRFAALSISVPREGMNFTVTLKSSMSSLMYASPRIPPLSASFTVLQMALAYRKAKVPMELHIFAKGQHGLSLATSEEKTPVPSVAVWIDLAITWLTSRGFVMKEKEN